MLIEMEARLLLEWMSDIWFIYSAWLALRPVLRMNVLMIAIQSTDTAGSYYGEPVLSSRWNREKARKMIRERVEAQVSVILLFAATGLSILKSSRLISPDSSLPVFVLLFGIVGTILFHLGWTRYRESLWFDHVWLTWLETQIPTPRSQSGIHSLNLVNLVMENSHPGLDESTTRRFRGRIGQPLTLDDREAIESWIRNLAKNRKHHFDYQEWDDFVKFGREPTD